MPLHPEATEQLAKLRDQLAEPPSAEQRLLARVPQFLDVLKALGHGHLTLLVVDGQLVRVDVMTSES
jgi:hypothetical protein